MQYEYLFVDRKRIGSNIEAIMKDRKCTKVTLSQAMNISRPTLDAFLKGDIHNAGKYDEYIKRLLVYMQLSDTVLDNYKTLPDVKKMRCNSVQKEVVKKLAARSSCVIIGRCSDYILRNNPRCVNVFIYAPDKVRVQNVMQELKVGEEKAKELIRENDQMLHARYKQMTGSNRGARHNRHMLIDSSVLGIEGTAEYIEEFVKKYLAKEAGAHGE